MQETWLRSLGWEDPLEKEMVTTPAFLPGKSYGLRMWGLKRVRHNLGIQQQHSFDQSETLLWSLLKTTPPILSLLRLFFT